MQTRYIQYDRNIKRFDPDHIDDVNVYESIKSNYR